MGENRYNFDAVYTALEREERKRQKQLLQRKRMRDSWKFVSPRNKKRVVK